MQVVKLPIQLTLACVMGLSINNIAFAQADTFKWENTGLGDGQGLTSGSQYNSTGSNNKVTVTITEDTPSIMGVRHEADNEGGDTGVIELWVNNDNNDQSEKVCVTITFDKAVTGLKTAVSDIDANNSYKDAIEITYNGSNNVRDNTSITKTLASCVVEDDETYMNGYEGNCADWSPGTTAKLDVDFGTIEITDFTLCFFTSDDSPSDPAWQYVALHDLSWTDQTPVELSYFGATATPFGVQLNWTTESEIENLGFVLERRVDEAEFTEIASYNTDDALLGQGSVEYATDYEYVDKYVEAGQTYEYRLADVDYNETVTYHATRSVTATTTPKSGKVEQFTVLDAYPNPFNPSTIIKYALPPLDANYLTTVQIYDLAGKLVKTLLNEQQQTGWHSITWNGTDQVGRSVPAGVYLSKVSFGSEVKTIKVMLLK